jgi:hypothetical protein
LQEELFPLDGFAGAAQISGVVVLNVRIALAQAIAGGIGSIGLRHFVQPFVDQAGGHLHVRISRILAERPLDGIARLEHFAEPQVFDRQLHVGGGSHRGGRFLEALIVPACRQAAHQNQCKCLRDT